MPADPDAVRDRLQRFDREIDATKAILRAQETEVAETRKRVETLEGNRQTWLNEVAPPVDAAVS